MLQRTFVTENRHLGMEKSCNVSTTNQALPLIQGSSLKEGMHISCTAGLLYVRKAAKC